jgi:DNA polymerase I-like protein with 3'-5' exonuclease and polymerase domains
MVLQVHDELLLEVAEKDREKASAVVREEMEGDGVGGTAAGRPGVGRTWSEAH